MDVDACDPLPFLQVKFLLSGLVLLDLIDLPLLCVKFCCHVSIIIMLANKSQDFFLVKYQCVRDLHTSDYGI